MIYVLIGVSAMFLAIGLLVTEKNAKYLLSGYNTMSEAERKNVDIASYIPYFRRFHIFLAFSFLILGLGLYYFVSIDAAGIFLGVYPILAYIFFIRGGARFSKTGSSRMEGIAIGLLVLTLVFVAWIFVQGFRENALVFDAEKIVLKGSYGETIAASELRSIALVDSLPQITQKTNGFALGSASKGFFRTKDGEIVKLILNVRKAPYICIAKADGKKVYFAAKSQSTQAIYQHLTAVLPEISAPE